MKLLTFEEMHEKQERADVGKGDFAAKWNF